MRSNGHIWIYRTRFKNRSRIGHGTVVHDVVSERPWIVESQIALVFDARELDLGNVLYGWFGLIHSPSDFVFLPTSHQIRRDWAQILVQNIEIKHQDCMHTIEIVAQ